MAYRLSGFLAAILVAIVWAALAEMPYMNLIPVVPRFVANCANGNPNFRNFPAFGLLSAATFATRYFVWRAQVKLIRTALLCALTSTLFAALL